MGLPAFAPSETPPAPEKVTGIPTRSGVPLGTVGSLLFGLPFLGMGTFIMAIGAGLLPSMNSSRNAPGPVIICAGAAFALAGLMVSWQGAKSLYRKLTTSGIRARRPDEPWLWDYRWHPSRSTSHKLGSAFKGFLGFLFLAVFLAPFNWLMFIEKAAGFPFNAIVGLFDLIGVAVLWGVVNNLLGRIKFGSVAVAYSELPLRLGSTASLRIEGLNASRPDDQVKLTLRFIEERFETRGSGDNRRTEIITYAHYTETRALTGGDLTSIEWQLPSNSEWASALSERPARFWDLQLAINSRGIDYDEHFLLPIY